MIMELVQDLQGADGADEVAGQMWGRGRCRLLDFLLQPSFRLIDSILHVHHFAAISLLDRGHATGFQPATRPLLLRAALAA